MDFICNLGVVPQQLSNAPLDPFAQILTLGVVWILFHCVPMCGPLVAGLSLGCKSDGGMANSFFLFHAGKGLIYVSLGALFGFLGERIDFRILGVILLALLALLLIERIFHPRFLSLSQNNSSRSLLKLMNAFRGRSRPFGIGVVMALLPCALLLWALGLAASTRSPVYGMMLMLFFLGLTSLPIGISIFFSRVMGSLKLFRGEWAGTLALSISFVWALGMNLRAWGIL